MFWKSKTAAALLLLLPKVAFSYELIAHLKHKNPDTLETLFWEIATPGSDRYLQFLTRAEIADLLSPGTSAVSEVESWFQTLGSLRTVVSPLRDTVTGFFDDQEDELLFPSKENRPESLSFLHRRDEGIPEDPAASRITENASNGVKDEDTIYTIANIKDAYGIPHDLQATNADTAQMVWGPGTFGYSAAKLELHKEKECPLINTDKIYFDTENHGTPGGDNFGEGQLDVNMISSFGLNVSTIVSNTNTTASTEETVGFGAALLDFLTDLAQRDSVPQVLSMSLGSLSAASCDLLCSEAQAMGFTLQDCQDYLATQRQVCMFLSQDQTDRINTALQVLGTRGISVFGSSGDGGSHFSFGPFKAEGDDEAIADALNEISCEFQIPVMPTASPYIVSGGGEMWDDGDSSKPITWAGYGGGSGSGFSIEFDQPTHQKKAVEEYLKKEGMPPPESYNASKRAYPDVSAIGVSGTSQSCPITAGIWSLIIDHRLNIGLPPLGFLAPRIYQVAYQHPGEAWEDIIGGDSSTSCDNGFPATDGFDLNTGWGRPIWEGLLAHFGRDDH